MAQVFASVNMERVLSETKEGKRIIDDIRANEEPKKQDYQRLVNEIMTLRNKFQAAGSSMNPEESLRLRQNIEQKELIAMRFQETTLRELENYRLETMAEFEKKVFPVIDKMAKDKGITMLFPYPQRWVIYADPQIDLTEEIIRLIDGAVLPQPSKPSASKVTNFPTGGGSGGPNRPKGNVKV